jgi:energy-coupling factor transporter ATP-binding protein EcfA2
MRIKQVSTLHWGGLPNMDYPFGAHTLLAGETGSGKTSLIDAIVAVMAGGGSRYSKFNIAQAQPGQSSKKSRRTLASYVVGGNGMGRFLRPGGAHGYVCVSWDTDESDGPYGTPFTALIGAEASLEREAEAVLNGDIVRILVRGHVVGLSDLMPSYGRVLPAQELIVSLRTKYGTAAVRDFKSGGEYLAMLYAYLKGDGAPVSREEADGAVKAFVSAIAYRQPDDIDGLTEHALTELRRIADYRNYRAYDFERRRGEYAVALSKWGTGSGGESETPVYVIRVAVMASAFKMFSQQKKAHFRSIFMDEVFSTMDEGRTRRVLRFLKELGLQIACAAPTRSMAAVLDEFDTRINFSKYETVSGDRSDVNIIDLNNARVRALYEAHRNAVAESAAAAFEKTAEPPLRVVTGETTRVANSGGS